MSAAAELLVVRPGLVAYDEASRTQAAIADARRRGAIGDVMLVLEHPPVFTRGRRSGPRDLPMGEEWYRMQGIEVADTDRGGQITYHGPGQLVAYPILDLRAHGFAGEGGAVDVLAYVRGLEQVMISTLAAHGVPAQIFDGLTGVWTAGQPPIPSGQIGPQGTPVGPAVLSDGEARKIGSIGIHLSRGISTHGLAINVNNDLQPFDWAVTCGIESVRMTSVGRELGGEQDLGHFADTLITHFAGLFDYGPKEISRQELGKLTFGAAVP